MKIGIDIDNTILNTMPVLKEYCKDYNDNVVKRGLKMNPSGFSPRNLYAWTDKEKQDFCNKYIEEVVLQGKIKPKAKEIIKKLKEEGHIIYIITSRSKPMFKDPYSLTKKFLDERGIVYDKLITDCIRKDIFCEENDIDVMMDDEPHHIEGVSKTRPVIVFRGMQNRKCKGENVVKVTKWSEVYDILQNIVINK